ncbi:hypothetical protein F183_A08850 [Bryobacterales bacterium F-183]|nr:hypothetical protein F183_A08850 [Bryobacterales bacterium F-183]
MEGTSGLVGYLDALAKTVAVLALMMIAAVAQSRQGRVRWAALAGAVLALALACVEILRPEQQVVLWRDGFSAVLFNRRPGYRTAPPMFSLVIAVLCLLFYMAEGFIARLNRESGVGPSRDGS